MSKCTKINTVSELELVLWIGIINPAFILRQVCILRYGPKTLYGHHPKMYSIARDTIPSFLLGVLDDIDTCRGRVMLN